MDKTHKTILIPGTIWLCYESAQMTLGIVGKSLIIYDLRRNEIWRSHPDYLQEVRAGLVHTDVKIVL